MALMGMAFGYYFGSSANKTGGARPPEGTTNETITSVTSVTTPDRPAV
jgi:hypothetical protein